jgi:hypothetical protein
MSKYSQIALNSVADLNKNQSLNPVDAWNNNAKVMYPDSLDAQTKSCPKSVFLGLCEDGLVYGVKPRLYTTSKLNKGYALAALSHLKSNPQLNEKELWSLVSVKQPNNQMAVVKALYSKGYIVE